MERGRSYEGDSVVDIVQWILDLAIEAGYVNKYEAGEILGYRLSREEVLNVVSTLIERRGGDADVVLAVVLEQIDKKQ